MIARLRAKRGVPESARTRPAQGGFMAKWVRVAYQGREYFGKLEGDTVRVHSGSMFAGPEATSQTIHLAAAKLLTPSVPSKIVALIDNFHELVAKLDHAVPTEPLSLRNGRARRASTPSGCSVPGSRPRSIPASSS